MSAYDERPWLALYRDQPADGEVEFDNALDMFRSGVARDPSAVAVHYFDGSISRQELDRAQRRAGQRSAGPTDSPRATGSRSTCRTSRSS